MSKCVIRGASLRARAPHSCLRHTLGHKRTSKLLHVGSSKVTERLQYRHATQFQRPMYTRRRLRSRSEPVLPESNISSATATSAQAPVSMRPRRSIASYAAVAQAQPPASTLASAPPIATQTVVRSFSMCSCTVPPRNAPTIAAPFAAKYLSFVAGYHKTDSVRLLAATGRNHHLMFDCTGCAAGETEATRGRFASSSGSRALANYCSGTHAWSGCRRSR